MMDFDIPSLRADRLSTVVPERVHAGVPVTDPALFIFRSGSLSKARNMTVGFYTHDVRFECVWRRPEHYADLFLRCGVAGLIECDYSLWLDDALIQQAYNVFRTRWLGRYWQDRNLSVTPSLSWADERSFGFCFSGIPTGAPVVACECRTPGSSDSDRRAFLKGLAEGVKQVRPAHVCVYGGATHKHWLTGRLPEGPQYTLLSDWTTERRRVLSVRERREREKNQLTLFGGTEIWADVEAA